MRLFLYTFLCASAFLCGCAQLALKDLSDNQARMDKYLARQNQAFQALKRAVLENTLKAGMSKQYIETKYGEPLLSTVDKTKTETSIYRSPSSGLSAPLIYLRYTQRQKLASWEYRLP